MSSTSQRNQNHNTTMAKKQTKPHTKVAPAPTQIKLETGIPVPPKEHRTVYPFKSLEVGQSFSYPAVSSHYGRRSQLAGLRSAIATHKRIHTGEDFIARLVDGETTVRCWRIA